MATDKLIPSDISYNVADSLFDKGQVAMFIDGTWDVGAHRKALGKNFAAAALPAVPGCAAARPFLTTQMAFVNSYSKQQDLGFSLLKYIAPRFGIADFQVAGRIPARTADLSNPALYKDPVVAAYVKEVQAGESIPNVPEMNAVWTPAGNAIINVIRGKASPKAAADSMVSQIKQGIAQLH